MDGDGVWCFTDFVFECSTVVGKGGDSLWLKTALATFNA
jgi:hypothetical protein